MYDFTAAFIVFFALAGVASAFAVAALVRVATEQRTARTQVVRIDGGQRASFRRAA
jgi:predicted lysophospholipase L1 biosynthesis ABC-type transport system permease subunit